MSKPADSKGRSEAAGKVRSRDGRKTVRAAIAAAETSAPALELPTGFEQRPDGFWRTPAPDKAPFKVCDLFEVLAETRPEDGSEWGLLLRWQDRDGRSHEWIMRRALLAGDAVEVRARLAAGGLYISPAEGARRALVHLLASIKVRPRIRIVSQTGWSFAERGAAFVLPGRTLGSVVGEIVRLDLDPPPTVYRERGNIKGWKEEVSCRCLGNSRLLFGVSCGFAAPLLPVIGEEGGGFNLRGESSKGKTTIIDAAASVWGAPSKTGPDSYVRQWRSTANALETTAAAHNHTLLPMDEAGQADPREIPEVLYMLANGAGKARAQAAGGNRRTSTWLTLVLSSAEESAARLAEAAGRRIKAGQELRLIDLPAVVPGAFGCFETLHGAADGKAFSQAIRRAVLEHYGSAGPAFVASLAEMMVRRPDAAAELARRVAIFAREIVPAAADGQVQRAGQRFAVVGVAGEIASEFGITGWPEGAAQEATRHLFEAWLAERGTLGSREEQVLIGLFRRFLMEHGASRFEAVQEEKDEGAQAEPELKERTRTVLRAGWRWQEVSEIGERLWVYGIIPEVFASEIAGKAGLEAKEAQARLGKAGLIRGADEGGKKRWTLKSRRIPGVGRPRLIVAAPENLETEDATGDDAPHPLAAD